MFPGCATVTLSDLTSHKSTPIVDCGALVANHLNDQIDFPPGIPVNGGDLIEMVLTGVDNPASPGAHQLSVGTSSDAALTAGFQTVAGAVPTGDVRFTLHHFAWRDAGYIHDRLHHLPRLPCAGRHWDARYARPGGYLPPVVVPRRDDKGSHDGDGCGRVGLRGSCRHWRSRSPVPRRNCHRWWRPRSSGPDEAGQPQGARL